MSIVDYLKGGGGSPPSPPVEEPTDDALIVRPSSYSTWTSCQLAVQHSSDPRYDDRPSAQAAFGTGVHALNEQFILTGESPEDVTGTLGVWHAEIQDNDDIDIFEIAPKKKLREWASEMLVAHELWIEQFWQPVGSKLEVIGVEQTMFSFLGILPSGRDAWIRGTADLITPVRVIDWKTSSTGWPEGRVDGMGQLECYSHMARVNGLAEPTEGWYVVFNRKTQEWEWSQFKVTLSPEREALVVNEMWKMAQVIDAEAAMGQPSKKGAFWGHDGRGWWCSAKWCGAWNFCEAKHLLDDGKADEIRDGLITWKK